MWLFIPRDNNMFDRYVASLTKMSVVADGFPTSTISERMAQGKVVYEQFEIMNSA